MRKSPVIAFTGIDGSGKTTQARLLVEDLRGRGINVDYVWCRWEPFILRPIIRIWKRHKKIGNRTDYRGLQRDKESLLRNPVVRYLWLILFLIDYGTQILLRLRFKLLKGGVIVSDRLFYDSFIDQAINLGNKGERLLKGFDSWWMRLIFPQPDMVIYIDCPEDIAYKRKDDAPDIKYLSDRRRLYLKLTDIYNWFKIDGTLSVEAIAEDIKKLVYKKLETSKCQGL